jgi:hypothetical protein
MPPLLVGIQRANVSMTTINEAKQRTFWGPILSEKKPRVMRPTEETPFITPKTTEAVDAVVPRTMVAYWGTK